MTIAKCRLDKNSERQRARYVTLSIYRRFRDNADNLQIQQLNYKITVDLNSDIKSEVEGVRWLFTRRSVMGILFMAFMVLSSLRYASLQSHKEEVKKKEHTEAVAVAEETRDDEKPLSATEILAAN